MPDMTWEAVKDLDWVLPMATQRTVDALEALGVSYSFAVMPSAVKVNVHPGFQDWMWREYEEGKVPRPACFLALTEETVAWLEELAASQPHVVDE